MKTITGKFVCKSGLIEELKLGGWNSNQPVSGRFLFKLRKASYTGILISIKGHKTFLAPWSFHLNRLQNKLFTKNFCFEVQTWEQRVQQSRDNWRLNHSLIDQLHPWIFVLKQDVEVRCSQRAMCSNGSLGSLLKVFEFFGCAALKSLFHSPYRVFGVCHAFGLTHPLSSEQGALLQSH